MSAVEQPFPPAPPARRSRVWLYIVLGVLAGIIALGVGGYTIFRSVQASGDKVAQGVLGRFQDGTEAKVWDEAAPEFQQAVSRDQLTGVFRAVNERVGRPVSWAVTGVSKESFLGTNGMISSTEYTYRVTHEKGETTTTLRVDGKQRLLHINFNWE